MDANETLQQELLSESQAVRLEAAVIDSVANGTYVSGLAAKAARDLIEIRRLASPAIASSVTADGSPCPSRVC